MIVPSSKPGAPRLPVPTRKTGLVIWAALLAGLLLFAALAAYVGPNVRRRPGPEVERIGEIFLYMAGGLSAVMLLLSFAIPRRIVRAAPQATPDALALSRTIVASTTNEGPALFCIVAWMTTGNPWLAAPFLLSLLGLLLAFPSEARWARLGGASPPGAPRTRMVR
jgi:hypothetical protein